jgi:hypothetical protein
MGKLLPVKATDPEVLTHVALQGNLKKTHPNIAITDGSLELDKTKSNLALETKRLQIGPLLREQLKTGQREKGTQEDAGKWYFGPETSAP